MGLFTKLFGTRSEREVKKLEPQVEAVMALEEPYKKLTDQELRAKTQEFKDRYASGETLDALLPEAFAVCREAADRVLGMRPYRVQVVGGIVLHQGRIAEMKTGEGKTLVAILPAYLNALAGRGVHIVTVNDYLAKRDSEWMGKVYRFLGLSVGLIVHDLTAEQRRAAYAADITYGTNNELGFDYLRDNMAIYKQEMVQRGHAFAIVDEVDSILIDEARTPLIISGKGEESSKLYEMADYFVSRLKKQVFSTTDSKELQDQYDCDYIVDEKDRSVSLTQKGIEKAEQFFNVENLADPENATLSHHINQAMKARGLMKRDIDYVVKDGEVIIVDEFTGRLMYGRRYNEGLHQAIEAKEGVKVASENKTLATITFQNFFRLYDKLSGMTGTALTEEEEFSGIYNLDVVEIPTNKPVIRIDDPDVVYKTEAGKYRAVIAQIKECHAKGQPVLVGTISIEKSELLSQMLKREGIPHNVLNAKHHEKEAEIVAQAGHLGAVTIATNMAGRGTDIMLGGNAEYMAKNELRKQGLSDELIAESNSFAETEDPEILAARAAYTEAYKRFKVETDKQAELVRQAGGLFIIGTERHESRRIDNQLRGRSGRQGDPGVTQFYLSLEDDLMRLFGGSKMDSIAHMMEKTNQEDDMPIQAGMVSKSIESAQRQVESMHFAARKNVLEYDDVMNLQRKAIYEERNAILDGKSMTERIPGIIRDAVDAIVGECCPGNSASDDWDVRAIDLWAANMTGCNDFSVAKVDHEDEAENVAEALNDFLTWIYEQKSEQLGHDLMENLSAQVMLRIIDTRWMAHLQEMDYLKTGIGLRAFGQRDPLVEYKNEAYNAFQNLTSSMYDDYLRTLLRLEIAAKPAAEGAPAGGGRPAPAALAEQEDPLARKMSYSAPEQALEESSIRGRRAAAARAASGVPAAPPRPAAGKPQTYVKDKEDPYANVGRNDPCPCGSGKKFKKCHGQNL